jgi:aspartyl-tRNA synthetase, archaeal type
MEHVKIGEIKGFNGKTVAVRGFVKQVRDLKKMQFLILRDLSGSVQITIFKSPENAALNDIVSKIAVESSVAVEGAVNVTEFVKLNGVEIVPAKITLVAASEPSLPIDLNDFSETNRDLRLDWRFLDLRSREHQLIFRVQTTAEMGMREYWLQNGFIEIHSPKLVSVASESGAELFELDYFGKPAYLAQSPQHYKQMAIAAGFEKVFEIGPVFRANKSQTSRHTTEFTSVDTEIAWIDSVEDVMGFEERWINYFMKKVKEVHGEEIKEVFGKEVTVPSLPFPRVTMGEAKKIIKDKGYEVPPETKGDLDPTAERMLGEWAKETHGHEFVFVTEFPVSIRPFYHMRDKSDPAKTLSFDLLWNGLEVTTGSQREHRYDILVGQAIEKGISPENNKSYLDMFRFGTPPHGGFGFGLTRMLMNILGYNNIREVSYVYRGVDRITP